jgi:plastocyanin
LIKKLFALMAVVALVVLSASIAYAHDHRDVGEYAFTVGFIVEPAFEGLKNGVDLRVMKESHAEGEVRASVAEGALFESPALAHDQTFSFQVEHELEDMTIGYHNKLNHDMKGSITVSDAAQLSGTVEIEIRQDGSFAPADITVKPGTILVWKNGSSNPQSVTNDPIAGAGGEEPTPVEGLENTLQVEVTHVATGVSKTMKLRTIFRDPGHYTADLIPTAPGQYRFRFFGTIEGMEVNETFESGPGRFNDVQPISNLYFPESVPAARELESAVRGTQTAATQAQVAALQAEDRASSASTMGIIGIVLGAAGIAFGAGAAAMALRRR